MGDRKSRNPESRFVVAERKSFEFEWRNSLGAEEVKVTERSSNGTFTTSLSRAGALWLGKALCEVSVQRDDSFDYQDEYLVMRVFCKSNRLGKFLQLVVRKKRERKWEQSIRFPAGREREAWADLGVKIFELLKMAPESQSAPKTNSQPQSVRSNNNPQFKRGWEAPRDEQKLAEKSNTLRIWSSTSSKHQAWWSSSVLAKSNTLLVDWGWVRKKVEEKFGEVNLRVLHSGEALLSLKSSEAAFKLEELASLSVAGTSILFKRWNPGTGKLFEGVLSPEIIKVRLRGIPLHLRSEPVAMQIAKFLAKDFSINRDTTGVENDFIEVSLKATKWEDIPRIVVLEERGFHFPILIGAEEESGHNPSSNTNTPTIEAVGSTQSLRVLEDIRNVGREEEEGEIVPVAQSTSRVIETQMSQGAKCRVNTGSEKEETWIDVVRGPARRPPSPLSGPGKSQESNRFHFLRRGEEESGPVAQPLFKTQTNATVRATSSYSTQPPNPWGHSLVLSHRKIGQIQQRKKIKGGRNKNLALQFLERIYGEENQSQFDVTNQVIPPPNSGLVVDQTTHPLSSERWARRDSNNGKSRVLEENLSRVVRENERIG
ncbi:hypothetical protein FRX31_012139 [Thalictrum thalictroides]|uniref:Uncharacterized protein n=1 Tax=Thalictrum thalictroides TaxID=46969 RepID=A0A7J6WMT2_THATH|nr:hypothetical protein FRX31_012139 [Thalictrum thalictroides]